VAIGIDLFTISHSTFRDSASRSAAGRLLTGANPRDEWIFDRLANQAKEY
jgi:hypothetical protein